MRNVHYLHVLYCIQTRGSRIELAQLKSHLYTFGFIFQSDLGECEFGKNGALDILARTGNV